MRTLVLLTVLNIPAVVWAGQHGHSIGGSAPVGASGRAPVGAAGTVPIGAAGSLIRPAGAGGSAWRSGLYRGDRGGYVARPYAGTVSGERRYRNEFHGQSNLRRNHERSGFGVIAPIFWGYGVGYDPGYGVGYDGGYADDYGDPSPYVSAPVNAPVDPLTQHYAVQENMLGEEIDRLNSEIQELKQQQAHVVEPGPSQPAPQPADDQSANPQAAPPVTVVLLDGKQFQSSDFAVVNQTFWDFSKSPARRVPMTEVNVPASVQASAAAGAQFPN